MQKENRLFPLFLGLDPNKSLNIPLEVCLTDITKLRDIRYDDSVDRRHK
jgi:hypothetical protein